MRHATLLMLFAMALVAYPPKHLSHSKPVAKKPAVHAVAAAAHGRTRAISSRNVRGKKRSRYAHAAPAPSYQLHPDPDRYQQIQQALSDKGYFKGTVNGQWDEESVSAVRRFQADQKLDGDGKLTALTLTGLGLGPKHDGTTASSVPLSAVVPAAGSSLETETPPPFDPQ